MTRKTDWMGAAELPPDELARLLEADHDEVDEIPRWQKNGSPRRSSLRQLQ